MILLYLVLVALLLIMIVTIAQAIKFDNNNKVELYAEKEDKAVDISYNKLTMSKAVELKREYEDEGYTVTITIKKRAQKENK